ncbi:ABC transporter permease [Niveispirillum sp. KHB5.9]|uniref:ABC transporter permease n=1 Tax=Niveispirillum sp. KHB5.9 TaxID=3400269 RepID=UPI003A8B63E7
MLRNWFMVALRNLLRHKLYTAINVLGLAAGLAAALLITIFVRHELSYNSLFTDAGKTWRMVRTEHLPGRPPSTYAAQSMPTAAALKQAFPQIETIVRSGRTREIVKRGDESLYVSFHAVDTDYLRVFDWPFLAGDPQTALSQPNSVVLTKAVALKIFGEQEALGRTLTLVEGRVLTVTGVMKNPPSNVTDEIEALVSIATPLPFLERQRENWGSNWLSIYIQLAPGTDMAGLEADLKGFLARTRPSVTPESDGGYRAELSLQPLLDIRTHPLPGGAGTSMAVISGLIALAALIMAIAAINFVNLATARATMRAREVALRKTLGAPRRLIIVQFLGESLLLTLLAGFLAMAVVEVGLEPFQTALGIKLDAAFHGAALMGGMTLGLSVLLGLLGGLYPAFVLSGFRPAQVLRSNKSAGVGGGRLRAALVVAQFAVAIGLSVGTLVVLEQTRYASSQELGFDKENVVLLRGFEYAAAREKLETFKQRLLADPAVASVAGAPWAPADPSERTSTYGILTGGRNETMTIRTEPVDFGYFETLDAKMVAGRSFDRTRGTDELKLVPEGTRVEGRTAATIISATAVQQFGWGSPAEAIGRTINYPEDEGDVTLQVIGVVADLQYKSARTSTVATIYQALPDQVRVLMVRLRPGDMSATLNRIDSLWREMVPDVPLRRHFLDEGVERLYADDIRQGKLFAAFAGLAVIIACLGLFGLASFTAERRTKEIGIRKVLGASVPDLIRLLVWQFSRPVLVANLIAWPAAWYGLSRWLEGFAYRVDLNPLVFLAAGAGALMIAWVTVAGHAARVAVEKPVKALRYE